SDVRRPLVLQLPNLCTATSPDSGRPIAARMTVYLLEAERRQLKIDFGLDGAGRSPHNACPVGRSPGGPYLAPVPESTIMDVPGARIPTAVVLLTGVVLGWLLASFRPVPARAGAGDRSGESILATGPVLVRFDEGAKAAIPLDALYFLDYKGGRLMAT